MTENNPQKEPLPPSKPGRADQRYLPRWEVDNRVVCQLDQQEKILECRSRDISCAGACLLASGSLPQDKRIKLTIYFSEKKSVDVEGQVVWTKTAQGETLAGVIFQDTPQKIQDQILKYAFEIKKEDLIEHWFHGWDKKKKN